MCPAPRFLELSAPYRVLEHGHEDHISDVWFVGVNNSVA